MRNEVRRVVELAAKAPDHVAVGLAERVRHTLVPVGCAELFQHGGWLDPRRRQLDLLERHRLLYLATEAELLADPGRSSIESRTVRLPVGESPAPVLSPARVRAGYQWMPRISDANMTCSVDASSSVVAGAARSRGLSPRAALESGNSL